jgi:phosphinothricin acetyltransferase
MKRTDPTAGDTPPIVRRSEPRTAMLPSIHTRAAIPEGDSASGMAAALPSIRIRAAADGDMEAIAAIYGHHVRHGTASFETEPPAVAEMMRRRAATAAAGYPYLVAENGRTVAGYAYAAAYRPRAAYRDTVENSIYLRPDAVGRGIGSLLLAALIAACEARGYRQMIAVVGDSANTASIRLHQRHGFRLIGTLQSVGRKHGRWLDSVLLQRPLGMGDTAPPQNRQA